MNYTHSARYERKKTTHCDCVAGINSRPTLFNACSPATAVAISKQERKIEVVQFFTISKKNRGSVPLSSSGSGGGVFKARAVYLVKKDGNGF